MEDSEVIKMLEQQVLISMSFQIKKKKNRDIFIKFFAERFPDHVRTANLDYMSVWVSRFNNKKCYWNADGESTRILKSLGYKEEQ
jgi:hypothetical protein